MKQFVSCCVLSVIITSSFITVFGQKNWPLSQQKIIKSEAAVSFQSVEAFTGGTGVYLRWQMVNETDNLGFQIIRITGGANQIVGFVAGAGMKYGHQTVSGEEYEYFDAAGQQNSQYIVQSFERSGRRTPASAVTPTFVADLSSVAGDAYSSLVRRSETKPGYLSASEVSYSKELRSEMDDHSQLADPATQLWVAAQPGAKIGVRATGMFRVTRSQLQTAGFDVNSDPAMWQLYTDGVQQSIIVGPNGDYVDFYGKSLDTVESDTRMYYLVVGPQAGRRMLSYALRPSFTSVKAQNYDQSVTVKERENYLLDVFNGDAENYFGHVYDSSVSNTAINLSAVDPSALSGARVIVRLLGYSPTTHAVNITLNGHSIGQVTGAFGTQVLTLDVTIPASYLVEGNNALGMSTTNDNDYGLFDSVTITYKRRHVSDQNKISFTTQNYRGARVEGFSSSAIRLFDITYDGDPTLITGAPITPNGGGFDINVPAYRGRAMYAAADPGLLSPFSVTANAPSTLATGIHNANLVIISYKDFMTQANAWADYRRSQGTLVEVVNVDDIYDEFNYGVLSANSMRDFLNFARQNWQTVPQYVLLIGDGSYDPRNYEGNGYLDLVPAKFFDSAYDENPSDDAIVDFNNDGLAEMAIGRIPARDTSMVTNALNKTVSFEANITPQNISRGFTCNYDNPIGWDFQAMCQMMANQLPAGTPTSLIPRADTNPNAPLVTDLNNGRFFVNFSGHGTTGSWSSSNNFNVAHVPLLTNINGLSIYTMLTCLNGYFVGPNVSMGEALLNSTTGGAVAAWASTGTTTPDIQQTMGVRFYNQVGAGQITRLGDLIRDAKTVVAGGRDVRLSWVLIGDPMLKTR